MPHKDLQLKKLKCYKFISVGLIVFLSFTLNSAMAQESDGSAGTFLRMGVGARALAMGGAFAGIANDPSATYWNPAGLYQIRNLQFEFMNVNLPFDRKFNFLSGVVPIKNIFTLGISWIGLRISEIEGRNFNSKQPEYIFSSNQNAFMITVGKSIIPILSVGGSIKFIKNDIENSSATGMGLDAAFMLHPLQQLKFGLIIQDIGTDIRWNGSYTEAVPLNLRFGAAWEVYNNMTITAGITKTQGMKPGLQFGGEARLINAIPIRFGVNDKQVSGGVGLSIPFSGHSLELNYSYVNDEVFHDAIHRLSLVFSFGHKINMRRKTEIKNHREYNYPDKITSKKKDKIKIVVNAKVLNVRSGPGVKYKKISQILQGEQYEALQQSGNWQKIRLNGGKSGWVHVDYIRLIKP